MKHLKEKAVDVRVDIFNFIADFNYFSHLGLIDSQTV